MDALMPPAESPDPGLPATHKREDGADVAGDASPSESYEHGSERESSAAESSAMSAGNSSGSSAASALNSAADGKSGPASCREPEGAAAAPKQYDQKEKGVHDETEGDEPWLVLSGGNEERRPLDIVNKLVMAPSGLLGVPTPEGREGEQGTGGAASSKLQAPQNGPLVVAETEMPKLQIPRYGHVACVTSGRDVLVVGGRDGQAILNSVERLDEGEGRWVSLPALHFARAHHAGCAISGGRAVVLGGENDKGVLKSVELYHPVKRNWINLAPMQHQRHSFGAVAVGPSIFAIGGRDAAGEHGRVLKTVEGLTLPPMPSPTSVGSSSAPTSSPVSPVGLRSDATTHAAASGHTPQKGSAEPAGSALSAQQTSRLGSSGEEGGGGGLGGVAGAAEGWKTLPAMRQGRASFGVAQYRGMIFCAGGTNGVKPLSSVEMFNSLTNEWTDLPSLNEARIGATCFIWLQGSRRRPHLCVAGGRQSSLHPVFQSAEILDLEPFLPSSLSTAQAKEAYQQHTEESTGGSGRPKAETEKAAKERDEKSSWTLVNPMGVKLCWQHAGGVVARHWKDELLESPSPPLFALGRDAVAARPPPRARSSLGRRSLPHTLSGGAGSSGLLSSSSASFSLTRSSTFSSSPPLPPSRQPAIPRGVVAAAAKRFQSFTSGATSSSSSFSAMSPSSPLARARTSPREKAPAEKPETKRATDPASIAAPRAESPAACGLPPAQSEAKARGTPAGGAARHRGQEEEPETPEDRSGRSQAPTTRIRTLLSDDCLEANQMHRQDLQSEGDGLLGKEVLSRNLEEADKEHDFSGRNAETRQARTLRASSGSSVASGAASSAEGSPAPAAEKGPSKVQLLRQKIELQTAERHAAIAKQKSASRTTAGARQSEVLFDPLEWLES
ncbi:kelch repeat-containing protein [Besnoitia besnoiti]|uniref:Kelch repeat-containing protein n=1 Tax=Besnoitia besnoiti TaxID=94643 RepID=A0A2A9MJJ3_BESBE|nr:kelch repeat-containing protein [Besnoitia besnoiti]PFH37344.1 kelch repeat-containing protein [Besnoitia besnoiti]